MSFAIAIEDEELIFRRTAGVIASVGDELAMGAQDTLVASKRLLVKLSDRQVSEGGGRRGKAELVELTAETVVERMRKRQNW